MTCSKTRSLALLLIAPCLTLATSRASAEVMTCEGTDLSAVVQLHAPGHSVDGEYADAGQILVTYNGLTYKSYCVDIDQYVSTTQVTEMDLDFLTNPSFVAFLFETYGPAVQSDVDAAALGVALWEVLNEDQATFDAASGNFYVTGNVEVVAAANVLLDSLPNDYTATTDLVVLHSTQFQDVLIGQAQHLPEPAAASMLMLGGLTLLMRRRRG